MAGFKCPFCSEVMVENYDTKNSFDVGLRGQTHNGYTPTKSFNILIYACPNCGQLTIEAKGNGIFEGTRMVNPISMSRKYPDYVPKAIRSDYEEAHAIKALSPKAAATLARRCLQGMIHDFWEIREKNLNAEISSLQPKVPASQWAAIDGLRRIGNIGAHMEKDAQLIVDVEPDEADKLIRLIEMLLDKWYIARHDEEELLSQITGIAAGKELARSR